MILTESIRMIKKDFIIIGRYCYNKHLYEMKLQNKITSTVEDREISFVRESFCLSALLIFD
jgi:hypothetical protein